MLLGIISHSQDTENIITANINPDKGELYRDDVVPRIDITINPDTLVWLFQEENLDSDIEFSAQFVFNNGTVTDTIYPVGFRLRGNTSRHSQKKSFKISFNTFTSGAKYYGVEKLNINGEHNDPSVMRSKICWDILNKLNVPASRANHVQLYINGNYYGVYLNVEHIDEEFIKSRFIYNHGNLYKCLWPADLNYISNNPDDYKFENDGRRTYELKINEDADDYSGLANFIDVLNNAPDNDFMCRMDTAFVTAQYLKIMAAEIIFGHWDNYIYNRNNYYLYDDPISGKFIYLPYDLDNTMGVDWMNVDWQQRNIYNWQSNSFYAPLYERIMDNSTLRDQYSFIMKNITENLINTDSLFAAVNVRKDMVEPYVANDPYYPLDYGFTLNDYINATTTAAGGHVKSGIFPYLTARFASIGDQLVNNATAPLISNINYGRVSANEIWVNASVVFQNFNEVTHVLYTFTGEEQQQTTMYDDGNHNDYLAGDGIYGAFVTDIPDDMSLDFQVSSMDVNGKFLLMPCYPVKVPAYGSDDVVLFINEFMADNESTIADEHGDYDDWIEIYSPETNDIVWLGDKYLTDDLSEPGKWQFPDTYIQPGEFLLVWADDDLNDGELHANFKLSKDGEEIGLFASDFTTIDEYVFGPQSEDVSEGRLPDGDITWEFFTNPTPGASNETSAVTLVDENSITLYPNPAGGNCVNISEPADVDVYNVLGELMFTGKNLNKINISDYNKGFYIVVLNKKNKLKLLIK